MWHSEAAHFAPVGSLFGFPFFFVASRSSLNLAAPASSHSGRSGPAFFLPVRFCEPVGLRRGESLFVFFP